MAEAVHYQRYTELTPEVIEEILQHADTVVDGTVEGDTNALCNEVLPSGWVRRIVRILVKSAVVPEVQLTVYVGLSTATKLTTLLTRYQVANLSVLPLETHDFRVGLLKLVGSATLNQFYGIVDANSVWLEYWYYDWPW